MIELLLGNTTPRRRKLTQKPLEAVPATPSRDFRPPSDMSYILTSGTCGRYAPMVHGYTGYGHVYHPRYRRSFTEALLLIYGVCPGHYRQLSLRSLCHPKLKRPPRRRISQFA